MSEHTKYSAALRAAPNQSKKPSNVGARHESEALPYGGIERAPIGRFLG